MKEWATWADKGVISYMTQAQLLDNMSKWWYNKSMFDEIIYKVLDKIVTTCECLKKCIKERSLPEACTNDDVKKEEVKKWAKGREKKHK